LGLWNFKEKYKLNTITKNRAQLVSEMVQRFSEINCIRVLSLDLAALAMYRLQESYDTLIIKGRYRLGECWTLIKKLDDEYNIQHDNPFLEEFQTPEQIIDNIVNSEKDVDNLVNEIHNIVG